MWSKGFIPFQEKLHRTIDPLLNGFEYFEDSTDKKVKVVHYSRIANPKDQLIFWGMMFGDYDPKTQSLSFNWLRCQVISAGKVTMIYPVSPSTGQSSPYATSGWIYTDEIGLDESLQQINNLVKENISNWFSS